ncbi:hypothetical protein BGX38DRAFT_263468 [Terfezia claveryi]|nr:hypothetical protein BGX38DRAFT_263468 [Terfezia claveryi]
MTSSLEQLKASGTTVVCDSGDFATIAKYKPQDATTNPSLILAASKKPEYAPLVNSAVAYGRECGSTIEEQVDATLDMLLVEFGKEILKIVPGKVSTEVDAKLSFDKQASIDKALHIIDLYNSVGISKDRILIKVASTWEAIAAAEAGAYLISPFVGRIMDYYKALTGKAFAGHEDPGVQSVQTIYNYYKKFGYDTIVMGASFRNVDEIIELAGCDYLTIAVRIAVPTAQSTFHLTILGNKPSLLENLYNSTRPVPRKLNPDGAKTLDIEKKSYIDNEAAFRYDFNENPMAVDKLAQGIRSFAADAETLKKILRAKIEA